MKQQSYSRQVIGGDFELRSLSLGLVNKLLDYTHGISGTWTASGRSALTLVLKELKNRGVNTVHVPAFLCNSILTPLTQLGLDYKFYPVDLDLKTYPDPSPGSAIIAIHYFGWLDESIFQLRSESGDRFHLIEDVTHALLSDWSTDSGVSRSVFLTPRKLGPVPLGGWCSVDVELEAPHRKIDSLAWQSLMARLARSLYLEQDQLPIDSNFENFYLSSFKAVEEFLDQHPTYASVPRIALEIIAGLDWSEISKRRRANWRCLHELLSDHVDTLLPILPNNVVPFGYVVRLQNRDAIRKHMAANRIFCAAHWPLPNQVQPKRFSEADLLSKTCLTLPIDQRYGVNDMVRIAETLKSEL